MSKKTMKTLTFIVTILLVLTMGATIVLGATPADLEVIEPEDDDIMTIGGRILGVLQTVGVVLAVIVLVILGIKYMMGSAEEKAEYKKTMIPYLVGAVFIFLAPTIANIIYGFITGMAD